MSEPTLVSIGECMIELTEAGGRWTMAPAGDAYNVAVRCGEAAEGEVRVRFLSAAGDDELSARMRDRWADAGIDAALVHTVPGGKPGLYAVFRDECGERSFQYWRTESAARSMLAGRSEDELALLDADCVFFSGITLAILEPAHREKLLTMVERAREVNTLVAFDANLRPDLWTSLAEARAWTVRALRLTDIALPTFGDDLALFGGSTVDDVVRRHRDTGIREVVVKHGDQGVHVVHRDVAVDVPADLVAPVDTTGAGDAFDGAYLAARLRGREPITAARTATRAAARAVLHPGALDQRPLDLASAG